MKGTIVGTWVKTANKIWGNELVEQAIKEVGWPADKIFLPTEDIVDEKPFGFAASIAIALGKSADDVWFAIGKDNITTFSRSLSCLFPARKSLFIFTIHV